MAVKFRGTKKALYDLLDSYVYGAESGDSGYWNPYDMDEVVAALKALGMTQAEFEASR
jgi:hypothetical protein